MHFILGHNILKLIYFGNEKKGPIWPVYSGFWAHWAPISERSTIQSVAMSGSNIGTLVAFPLGGFLCKTIGWESIFYILGSFGVLMSFVWFVFSSDKPSNNRWMNPEEKIYFKGKDNQAVQPSQKTGSDLPSDNREEEDNQATQPSEQKSKVRK